MHFSNAILTNQNNVLVESITYDLDIVKNYCSCKAWLFRNKNVPNMLRSCKHLVQGYNLLLQYRLQNVNQQDCCTLTQFSAWKRENAATIDSNKNKKTQTTAVGKYTNNARYFLIQEQGVQLHENHVDYVLMTLVYGALQSSSRALKANVKVSKTQPNSDSPLDFLQVSSESTFGSISTACLVSEKFDGVRVASQGTYLFPRTKRGGSDTSSPRRRRLQLTAVEDESVASSFPIVYTKSRGEVVVPKALGGYLRQVEKFIAFYLLNYSSPGATEKSSEFMSDKEGSVCLRVFVDGELVCSGKAGAGGSPGRDEDSSSGTDSSPVCLHQALRKNCFVASVNLSQLQLPETLRTIRTERCLAARDATLYPSSSPQSSFPSQPKDDHLVKKSFHNNLNQLWSSCGAKFVAFDFRVVGVEKKSDSQGVVGLASIPRDALFPEMPFEERKNVLERAMEYVDANLATSLSKNRQKRHSLLQNQNSSFQQDLLSFLPAIVSPYCSFFACTKQYPLLEVYSRLVHDARIQKAFLHSTAAASSARIGEVQCLKMLSSVKRGTIGFLQCQKCNSNSSDPSRKNKSSSLTKKKNKEHGGGDLAAPVALANCMALVASAGKEGVVFRDPKGLYVGGRSRLNSTWKCKPLLLGFLRFPKQVKDSLLHIVKRARSDSLSKLPMQLGSKEMSHHLRTVNEWEPRVTVLSHAFREEGDDHLSLPPCCMGMYVFFRNMRDSKGGEDVGGSQDDCCFKSRMLQPSSTVPLSRIIKPSFVANACPSHLLLQSLFVDKTSFSKLEVSRQELTSSTVQNLMHHITKTDALQGFFVFFSIWNALQEVLLGTKKTSSSTNALRPDSSQKITEKETISAWKILQDTVWEMLYPPHPRPTIFYGEGQILVSH